MIRALATELQKMKRSVLLWVILACLLIPLGRGLLDRLRLASGAVMTWQQALSLRADYWAFGAFVVVVVAGSYVITREIEDGTIRSILCTPHSASLFLFAKLLVTTLLLAGTAALSLGLRFLGGLVFASGVLTRDVALGFLGKALLVFVQFALLIPWIALVGTIARRMYAALLTCLGLIIMLFPFHRTARYCLFPHLVPVVHFSSLIGFDSSDRAFTPEGWISLGLFSILTMALCFALYRRR